MKVIAEFDKPESCETCPCFYQTEGAFCDICQLTNTEIKDYFIVDKSCPLKEKNEWHYVSKQGFPKNEKAYLVLIDYGALGNECGVMENLNRDKTKNVVAWKEIVLPELPKEIEE